ncbi:MAG: AI-2E family transporter [Solirubrobacteraceae bacterium]
MTDARLTPGAIYRAVLLAFGLIVAGLVFEQLATLVLAVLIVVITALALAAFATRLERFRVPRALGAVLGLLLGLGALVGLITAIIPVFSHEINQFVAALPHIVDSLRHKLGQLTGGSNSKTGQQVQQFVNGYTQHPTRLLGPLASIGVTVAGVLGAIVVILLTALYTAISPQPLLDGLRSLVPPARRPLATHVLRRLGATYLGWLRGLVVGMVVLGLLTYFGLRLAGLDFAAFFAVLTAVAMIVPYFGALASSIPPILYALTISPGKALVVAGIYLVAHQVEANLIEPLVMARTVKLHPAVIAFGVIAVERLFGFVGLIVAVPILGTVNVLAQELWIKPLERPTAPVSGSTEPGPGSTAPGEGSTAPGEGSAEPGESSAPLAPIAPITTPPPSGVASGHERDSA